MSVNMQKTTMVLHTFEITLVCSTCQKLKHPLTVAVGPPKQVIQLIFSQKHFRCLGSRLVYFAAGGSDTEATKNSLGRAPLGGSHGSVHGHGGRTGNRGK